MNKTAAIKPSTLLDGAKPRLIDKWQDASNILDAVRTYFNEHKREGHFVLTVSTSKKVETHHTGTGRISRLKMYPMSLFESKESNGKVSLKALFDGTEMLSNGCISDLTIEQLIFASCRGGWPESVIMSDREAELAIPRDYFTQIYEADMFKVDGVRRDNTAMKIILQSLARNLSTLSKTTSILSDVNATRSLSENTLNDYINVLEKLFVIEDLKGWCPAIRSKSAIRSGRKREFVDPSIAVAAMGASPERFHTDLLTFGFVFECQCIRDLRVYSTAFKGDISYYHYRYGLESDAVLHLDDCRYALIEFKLISGEIHLEATHICENERLVGEYNKRGNPCPLRMPDLKLVVTGTKYRYRRNDGVFVIPIGCLRD